MKHRTPGCRIATRGSKECRRRPTLPRPLGRSTIGAVGLNDRVRDGNECGPYALVASVHLWKTDDAADDETRVVQIVGKKIVLCRNALLCVLQLGVVKPHGRLVPLRSEPLARRPRAAYRRGGLPRPLRELEAPGSVHLGGSFPLRCFQRLSAPAIATRRCSWQSSRDTSGLSDPVLSY